MTVLHTGWTKKFGTGWDSIFGGKKSKGAKVKPPQGGTTNKTKKKSDKKQRAAKKVHSKR